MTQNTDDDFRKWIMICQVTGIVDKNNNYRKPGRKQNKTNTSNLKQE